METIQKQIGAMQKSIKRQRFSFFAQWFWKNSSKLGLALALGYLWVKADKAQRIADQAQSDAYHAQSNAGDAKSTADDAKYTAGVAKRTADDVQLALYNLQLRLRSP